MNEKQKDGKEKEESYLEEALQTSWVRRIAPPHRKNKNATTRNTQWDIALVEQPKFGYSTCLYSS